MTLPNLEERVLRLRFLTVRNFLQSEPGQRYVKTCNYKNIT